MNSRDSKLWSCARTDTSPSMMMLSARVFEEISTAELRLNFHRTQAETSEPREKHFWRKSAVCMCGFPIGLFGRLETIHFSGEKYLRIFSVLILSSCRKELGKRNRGWLFRSGKKGKTFISGQSEERKKRSDSRKIPLPSDVRLCVASGKGNKSYWHI